MRLRALLLAVLLMLVAAAPAAAGDGFAPCRQSVGECATVEVPLDRSGRVPGTVRLFAEKITQAGAPRDAVFALAGGPGQGASSLTLNFNNDLAPILGRRRSLVVFDQRGTGRSGALNCRGLERPGERPLDERVAECAAQLGERRSFYTTRDSVEDLEAVRRRVGDDRIDLYGVSYGTKVAVAYALAYPQHVERLILDSVVEPEGQNPFDVDTFAAIPRVLREVCRGECRGVTRDLSTDVSRLAARLRARPLRGAWYDGRGRRRTVEVTGRDLYSRLRQGDLNPDVRAEYPGAIRSAVEGDPAPLLRLEHRFDEFAEERPGDPPVPEEDDAVVQAISFSLMTATLCEEAPLPWDRTASPEERLRQARERASAVPDTAFAPFDRDVALALDPNSLFLQCARWPALAEAPLLASGTPPDVPVLVVEGREDLRTPLEVGRRLAGRFPRAQLLSVPKTGHSVLGEPGLTCGRAALRRFFAGRAVGRPCARVRRRARVRAKLPAVLGHVPRVRGVRGARRQRTLGAVVLTLQDFYREYRDLSLLLERPRGGGLRGGRWAAPGRGATLTRFSLVPGVRVSARFKDVERPAGRIRVSGGVAGTLTLRRGRLTGRLGDAPVRARFAPPRPAGGSGD